MEKSKIATTVDEMLRGVAIWLLSAICLRYVLKQLYLIIIISTAITMLVTLLLRLYYGKKAIAKNNLKHIDDVMRELTAISQSEIVNKLAGSIGGEVLQDSIITQNTMIFPYFYGKLPLEKLSYAYNLALKRNKKLLVLCQEPSREVETNLDIFSEIKVMILSKKQSYNFLYKFKALPSVKSRPKKKRNFFKSALKKSKIKGYLFAALLLLITAAFSPYAFICIAMAAINITLSILCEVKGS